MLRRRQFEASDHRPKPIVRCGGDAPARARRLRQHPSRRDGGALHGPRVGGEPATRFVIAPRHADGVTVAEQEAVRRGWGVARRSERPHATGWRVLLLDTMGELPSFYERAEVAVVGGGFASHGGHNPYEPVRLGAPVFFGVHFEHFDSEARRLAGRAPESQVSGWQELGARLRSHLGDANRAQNLLERQSLALPDAAAIGQRYLEILGGPLSAIGARMAVRMSALVSFMGRMGRIGRMGIRTVRTRRALGTIGYVLLLPRAAVDRSIARPDGGEGLTRWREAYRRCREAPVASATLAARDRRSGSERATSPARRTRHVWPPRSARSVRARVCSAPAARRCAVPASR